jgi:hypothetical protein
MWIPNNNIPNRNSVKISDLVKLEFQSCNMGSSSKTSQIQGLKYLKLLYTITEGIINYGKHYNVIDLSLPQLFLMKQLWYCLPT